MFCPLRPAATISSWHFKAEDLNTEDCDGDSAVRRYSRVADESGTAMAHSAVAGQSVLRPGYQE